MIEGFVVLQQVCAASQQKSVAGLDNIAAEASEAFSNLLSMVESFGELGKLQM
jgi:hypothetical protein